MRARKFDSQQNTSKLQNTNHQKPKYFQRPNGMICICVISLLHLWICVEQRVAHAGWFLKRFKWWNTPCPTHCDLQTMWWRRMFLKLCWYFYFSGLQIRWRGYIYMLLILCNKCVFCPTWLGCVLQAVNRAQIVPPLGIYYFTKIAIFCIDIKFLFVRKWHQPSLSRWPTNCFLDELLSSKHVKPLFYLLPEIPWKQLNCNSPGLKLKHQQVATKKFLPPKV